jgi:hypothetical protein
MHHKSEFNNTTRMRYDFGGVEMMTKNGVTYLKELSQQSPKRNYEITRESLIGIVAFHTLVPDQIS